MMKACESQRLSASHEVETDTRPPKSDSKSKQSIELTPSRYMSLFQHLRSKYPKIRHYEQLPHPLGSWVLHPRVTPVMVHHCTNFLRISPLPPNNLIFYWNGGRRRYGLVKQIYNFRDASNELQTRVWISPIENLYLKPRDNHNIPSFRFRVYLSRVRCVVGQASTKERNFIWLDPHEISGVAAYRSLPDNTFKIDKGGIILRPIEHDTIFSRAPSTVTTNFEPV